MKGGRKNQRNSKMTKGKKTHSYSGTGERGREWRGEIKVHNSEKKKSQLNIEKIGKIRGKEALGDRDQREVVREGGYQILQSQKWAKRTKGSLNTREKSSRGERDINWKRTTGEKKLEKELARSKKRKQMKALRRNLSKDALGGGVRRARKKKKG